MFGGTPGIIQYIRNHHLLATQQNCSRCNVPMRERPRPDVSDGVSWWCSSCKTRKSIRNGSFFQKSHITLQKWLLLLHLWSRLLVWQRMLGLTAALHAMYTSGCVKCVQPSYLVHQLSLVDKTQLSKLTKVYFVTNLR